MTDTILYIALVAGGLALLLAVYYTRIVLAAPQGNERMVELSTAIREGAMAFLKREYTWVSVFVVVMAVLIAVLLDWGAPWGAVAYVFGAVLSALAGFVGMRIATAANARTTEAARQGGIATGPPCRFQGWCRHGIHRRRAWPARGGLGILALRRRRSAGRPQLGGHRHRNRSWRIVHRSVRSCGWRDLHQGSGRWR